MDSEGLAPLVFVYRGESFPRYAAKSLALAAKTTPNRLIVLADVERPRGVAKSLRWEKIADFYDSTKFAAFATNSTLDARFRNGFWLHAAERFFILEQFATHDRLLRFFHGELDCLFFDLDNVERSIGESKLDGMFLPRETRNCVVASLVYVNNHTSLAQACNTLLDNVSLGNEMDILGSLPLGEGSQFHAFPTAEYLFRGFSSMDGWPVAPQEPTFIIDGAALGRWLFGVDPRNTKTGASKNLIQNPKNTLPFEPPMANLRFQMSPNKKWPILVAGESERWLPIVVIHVHSKIHSKIDSRYITKVVRKASKGRQHVILRTSSRYLYSLFAKSWRHLIHIVRTPALILQLAKNITSRKWWAGLGYRLSRN